MRDLAKLVVPIFFLIMLTGCRSDNVADANTNMNSMLEELIDNAIQNQVSIEGGNFKMGDFGAVQNGQWLPYFPPTAQENYAHHVQLSSFHLSRYEVSWKEYDLFSMLTGRAILQATIDGEEERAPFDKDAESLYYEEKPARVEWQEAKDYCTWIGEQTGHRFDLPTSAQWEFAARNRGSKDWVYPTHNGQAIPNHQQQHMEGCGAWSGICPVGQRYPPNPLGLYDMAGNAREWVEDWFSPTYYQESDGAKDPTGPAEGQKKELRSLGVGSLDFSFSRTSASLVPQEGFLTEAGFRCAVQSPDPIR